MNKAEFLDLLKRRLEGLPEADRTKFLDYYSEMIDDRVEEGMSEAEAVAELGSMDEIVSSVLAETPIKRLVGAKLKKKSELRGWHIALLVLGAPLWIPLLIALLAIIFSVYITLFSLIFAAFIVVFSFAVTAVASIASAVHSLIFGRLGDGMVFFGLALFFAGLTLLTFIVASAFAKLTYRGTKAITLFIKSRFIRKEG